MARLTPRFSSNRAVREYTEQYYLPAVSAYRARAADKGAEGVRVVSWRHALDEKWASLRFGEVSVKTVDQEHVFIVQLVLGDLDPAAVRVELYANGVDGSEAERVEMKRVRRLVGAAGDYIYSVTVSAARLPRDYTPRVTPHFDGVAIPLEETRVLWQR